MTSGLPIGSSVYFIFLLIDTLAPAPVTGAENPYPAVAPAEAYGQDATIDLTETEKACLTFTVPAIYSNDALWIREGILCP